MSWRGEGRASAVDGRWGTSRSDARRRKSGHGHGLPSSGEVVPLLRDDM